MVIRVSVTVGETGRGEAGILAHAWRNNIDKRKNCKNLCMKASYM
jgi:hypothetical protein